ncbi:hypothetical protein DXG01_010619 [Tephrocybe rancida]|nr:hypothetical protein DXG01_010619 [Tephrocybe rancida]
MDHFPTNWGRPRNDAVDAYGTYPIAQRPNNTPKDAFSAGIQHTQQVFLCRTSVLAIKFKDGVMMAADNLASYGSLARFKDIQRLQSVGQHTVIGAGGDMSDFQYIQSVLDELVIDEFTAQDGHALGPAEIHNYLAQVMYARRSKMNPLWNAILVGGVKDGKRFLSFVDLLGTTYSASTLATGYGAHIAQPLLRTAVEGKEDILTEEEAFKILEQSMKVLYYRDARSIDKYQVATVTAAGVTISETKRLETSWAFAEGIRGNARTTHFNPTTASLQKPYPRPPIPNGRSALSSTPPSLSPYLAFTSPHPWALQLTADDAANLCMINIDDLYEILQNTYGVNVELIEFQEVLAVYLSEWFSIGAGDLDEPHVPAHDAPRVSRGDLQRCQRPINYHYANEEPIPSHALPLASHGRLGFAVVPVPSVEHVLLQWRGELSAAEAHGKR